MDYEKYDSVLFSLSHGGVALMFDVIFSFLSRKTDFYTGAGIEEAQSMVLKYFDKHGEEAYKLADTTKKRREEEQRKLDERQAAQKANEEAESAAKDDGCTVMDTTDEEAAEFEKNKTEVTSATVNEERSSTSDAGVTSEVKESKKQSDKMMPNSGKILDEFEKEFHQNISMLRTHFCQDGSMLQKVENEGDEAVKDLADSQRTISVISQKFVTALELLRESRTIGDERMQSCVKLLQQNDELMKMWKECLLEFIHWKGKYEDLKTALKKKDPAICAQKERTVEESSAAKETMSVNGLHVTEPEDACEKLLNKIKI